MSNRLRLFLVLALFLVGSIAVAAWLGQHQGQSHKPAKTPAKSQTDTQTGHPQPIKRPPLSPEKQKRFLAQRSPSGRMTGPFHSFSSMLYAIEDVVIDSSDKEINDARLETMFPDFYEPTWAEYFDAIARQTKSSWHYDATTEFQTDFWVFAKPPMPLPFTINLANGWTAHDEGMYVGYKPPTAPVGMDIYMLGTYSVDDGKDSKLVERVRDALAIRFATAFKENVSVEEMKKVNVGGVEALYFQNLGPRKNAVWRQWVLVKNGKGFAIVSALKEDDDSLLGDVELMVKSFHLQDGN